MAKYSKGAGKKVETALHEKKSETLKSGRSGKKVTSRKQAIAIGLSEARQEGKKVPKKAGAKKTAGKKAAKKKAAPVKKRLLKRRRLRRRNRPKRKRPAKGHDDPGI